MQTSEEEEEDIHAKTFIVTYESVVWAAFTDEPKTKPFDFSLHFNFLHHMLPTARSTRAPTLVLLIHENVSDTDNSPVVCYLCESMCVSA